ncbi:hypothetical protein GCM10027347_17170 [Larkinella harenae]
MILIINGVFNGTNWTNLLLVVPDEVEALERLSSLNEKGVELVNATLINRNSRQELPIEVLHEQVRWNSQFAELQRQWESVLSEEPVARRVLGSQRFVNWTRRLIAYYDKQINLTSKEIVRVSKKMEMISFQETASNPLFMAAYFKTNLKNCENRMKFLETARQQALQELNELGG